MANSIKQFDLEIGKIIKVYTTNEIVDGEIWMACGNTNSQQIWVRYKDGLNSSIQAFSKKTGKAYGDNYAKRKGHYLIK